MKLNGLLCLFIPVFGIIWSGFFGMFLGRKGVILITSGCIGLATIFAWWCLSFVSSSASLLITLGDWFNLCGMMGWQFSIDALSTVMLVVVLTVSFIVHMYSINYMKNDPHIVRFFVYLSLFTTFMLVLVTGSHLIILFIGWEGVGLCSYLLINFWFTRLQANKAALKAMIVNRVGDVCFLAALSLFNMQTGVSSFSGIITNINMISSDYTSYMTAAGGLVICAAVGKSAQLGLHTWLPDAMEGPTPLSALIHAATMVTAGVFLIIRVSGWVTSSSSISMIALIFGVATAIFAGTVGLMQYDIKRVVAYSTCSQLGYMIFACGALIFNVALFHLFNHAFFKALLFLGSGSVIHALQDEQDLRKYGVLSRITPYLSIIFFIASLSLIGFPFLSGFYSKDVILESTVSWSSCMTLWGYWLGIVAALFTIAYSFKITNWAFFLNTTNTYRDVLKNFHSSSIFELLLLCILALFGIFSGYVFKDLFYGFGSNFFQNSIQLGNQIISAEFLPFWIKVLPMFGITVCLMCSWYISLQFPLVIFKNITSHLYLYDIFCFLSNKWYFNLIQNYFFSNIALICGYESFWVWDRLILEQVRIGK